MAKFKIKHRPSSKSLFGKKNSLTRKIIFLASVGIISFFLFRAYEQHFSAFKKIRPAKPRARAIVYYPNAHTQTVKPSGSVLPPVSPSVPSPYPAPGVPGVSAPVERLWKASGRVWTNKPKIAIVIDDCGNNRNHEKYFRALGDKVTYAILPQLPYSMFMDQLSVEMGADAIVHQPMESTIGKNPGPGVITVKMNEDQISETLDRNFATVPHHVGINNHMGSLGTSNYRTMEMLLRQLKRRGAFFFESRTTDQYVSKKIARKMTDMPILVRDVFLDNVNEPAAIRWQLNEVRKTARNRGYAIAIGHDRPKTLKVLIEDIPKLEAEGFQLVNLSDLMDHGYGK